MFSVILLLTTMIKFNHGKVCERFTSHFSFYDCEITEPIRDCANWGTWECAPFECYNQIIPGSCEYGNDINPFFCCTQKNIRYVDFWFTPYEEEEEEDWLARIYNIYIYGKGSNITITDIDSEYVHDTAKNFLGNLTFISIVLDGHNDSSCETTLYFYINGNLSFVQTGLGLDLYAGDALLKYFILYSKENPQTIEFLSAHTRVPSPEDIYWLYTLGPNRTTDVEICYEEECHDYVNDGGSSGYKTATIILSIILGIILLLLLLLLIWWLVRYFSNNPTLQTYSKM